MKKRWTVADAQAVVDRMAVSGLSVREFAKAEGLETQRIYRWRSLLGEKMRPAFGEVKRPALATFGCFWLSFQGAQLRAFVREFQR